MKKQLFIVFIFLIIGFLVTSCGPKLEIKGDETASKVIIYEERKLLTIYARLENQSNLPSNKLYAKFQIEEPNLAEALGFEVIPFSDYHGVPEAFEISPNSGFFIAETYNYEASIPAEDIQHAVRVIVYNEEGNTVSEFPIQTVEYEK